MRSQDPRSLHGRLSAREFQVLVQLAVGVTLTKTAKSLGVSVKTASTYRTRLLLKMGLTTNAELTAYAMRNGLIVIDNTG